MRNFKKSVFCFVSLFFIFLIPCALAAQENVSDGQQTLRMNDLNAKNSSWTAVISGNAVCPPVRTSYGFAVMTDGKMISACSGTGAKLWERRVPGNPSSFLTVFSSDFLLTVSDGHDVSLINPSGSTLWTVNAGFTLTAAPLCGRDSRIFLKGKNAVSCYGLNGIQKWKLDTPALSDSDLYELDDGTLIALLEKSGGVSGAVRFSPFGEIMEYIDFTGIVKSASSCPDGVLLGFSSGGAGMCAAKDSQTVTKWTIPYSDKAFSNTVPSAGLKFLSLSNHRAAILVTGSGGVRTRCIVFSTFDGRVSDFFNINVDFSDIVCAAVSSESDDVFVCGKNQAFLYTTEGALRWQANLPSRPDLFSKWNYISYTQDNYLLICSTSWAMAAFHVKSGVKVKGKKSAAKKKDYSAFYNIDTSVFDLSYLDSKISPKMIGDNRRAVLASGGYGPEETEFASKLLTFCKAYNSHLMQSFSGGRIETKSIFDRDAAGVQELLMQLSLFGTDDFTRIIANVIKMENNHENLQAVLRSVGQFGYDPDSMILKAIGTKLHKLPVKDSTEFILMCDAVYEICRFMGRPALYSHGMEILTNLLYPQYESSVRDYARKTLAKIAALKI